MCSLEGNPFVALVGMMVCWPDRLLNTFCTTTRRSLPTVTNTESPKRSHKEQTHNSNRHSNGDRGSVELVRSHNRFLGETDRCYVVD